MHRKAMKNCHRWPKICHQSSSLSAAEKKHRRRRHRVENEEEKGDRTPIISNRTAVFMRLELETAEEESSSHCSSDVFLPILQEQRQQEGLGDKSHQRTHTATSSSTKDDIPHLPHLRDSSNPNDNAHSSISGPITNQQQNVPDRSDCLKSSRHHSSISACSSWRHHTARISQSPAASALIPRAPSSCRSWI